MKSIMTKLSLVVVLLMTMTAGAWAQDNGSQSIGATIKEVFLKGSIDGKRLFMVYGVGDMGKDAAEILKTAQNPIELEDLVDMGKMVNNKRHNGDYVDAVKEGVDFIPDSAEFAKESAEFTGKGLKNMVKWPWKSIKKIPGSYKVSFDNARDAYHHSDSAIASVFKYAGHAIWANVKGAYYLVVEAPIAFAGALGQTALGVTGMGLGAAGTVLAVPGAIAIQTLAIGFQALGITLKFAWRMTKNAAKAIAAFAMGVYSITTSGIATTAALITAGAIGVFKGGKWLLIDAPKTLIRPVRAKLLTDVALDDQEEMAKAVIAKLKETSIGNRIASASDSIKEYSSKITLNLKVGAQKVKAIIVKLSIKDKLVQLKAEATRKYLRAIKKTEGLKRKAAKAKVQEELNTLLGELATAM